MKTVTKISIPIDGHEHEIIVAGRVLHTERANWALLVWIEECDETEPTTTRVTAFQAGEQIPSGAEHLATSPGPDGFVWHLYALPVQATPGGDEGAEQ